MDGQPSGSAPQGSRQVYENAAVQCRTRPIFREAPFGKAWILEGHDILLVTLHQESYGAPGEHEPYPSQRSEAISNRDIPREGLADRQCRCDVASVKPDVLAALLHEGLVLWAEGWCEGISPRFTQHTQTLTVTGHLKEQDITPGKHQLKGTAGHIRRTVVLEHDTAGAAKRLPTVRSSALRSTSDAMVFASNCLGWWQNLLDFYSNPFARQKNQRKDIKDSKDKDSTAPSSLLSLEPFGSFYRADS